MEGNLSGERFPSFGFLYLCCGIRLIGKAEWWEPLPRGRSGNVMKRRGGSQRSIRMAPSSFSYERRLGALAPIELGNRIPLLRKKKSSFPDGPFSAVLQAVPLAASRSKETRAGQGRFPCQSTLAPCGVQGKRPCQYFGRSLWVRPRFRLASVRESVCRPVCWKAP